MRMTNWAVGVILALTLAACETPTTYPLSGEECSPDDPVLDMNAADCNVAPVIGGVGLG